MDYARLQFVELVLKPCSLTYGTAPCAAAIGTTGDFKCYNSPATCQDPTNFAASEQVLRFAVPTADLPVDYDYIPNVTNISVTAQKINPGESLGTREGITSTHFNHQHNDVVYDKYLSDRSFNPFNSGTHWGKFSARWPNIQGCEFRYVLGFSGQSIDDMDRYYYFVESTAGPDNNGSFSITAKDAIKFLDGDKALVPLASNGVLLSAITDTDMSLTLSPTGIGDTEYPASGIASMGDEKVSFTRSGDAITLIERHMSGSSVGDHDVGETFQLAEVFSGAEPSAVLYRLLNDFTDTPDEYLDVDVWTAETTTHIGRLFSREIMKPTSVKSVVDEIIQQVGLIIYTDTHEKKIVVRALRNLVPSMSLDDNSFMGQLTSKFDSDKRISQVLMYYAQKNPLEKNDEEKNYAAILNSFLGDPVSALESAADAIKKIYATWITVFNRPAAEAVSGYLLRRYGRAPRSVGLQIPINVPIKLGSVFTLDSVRFEDSQGMKTSPLLFQAVSVEQHETGCTVQGEQVPNGEEDVPDGVATVNIDDDSYNLNLRTIYDSIYLAPSDGDEIRFMIAGGVQIGSLLHNNASVIVGEWPEAVTLKIYRGTGTRIQGAGGAGGFEGTVDGKHGGIAFYTRRAIEFYDDGEIWGGGGGGGGIIAGDVGASGGGGAGNVPGIPWGTTEHGGGGMTVPVGGDPGENGANGLSSGGAAGAAIDGFSYVTFHGTDDIRGPQIN